MGNNRRDTRSRGRYRTMYQLTGVPGWIRFGTSPGMRGGGRGMGPCAEYLQRTGQFDSFLKDFTEKNPTAKNWQMITGDPELSVKFERDLIVDRISLLEEELKDLRKRLKEIK